MPDRFADRLRDLADWRPPASWLRYRVIDAHTAGEPLRIILDGWPDLGHGPILERRRLAHERHDRLRTRLMFEPRGHADMYGCLVLPPATDDAHFGVLFLHNEGFSTMCGHGIIAVTKVAVETGLVVPAGPTAEVRIDTPAGRVTAYAHMRGAMVDEVRFRNVPSFVLDLDQTVDVPGLGTVTYDLAFGGAFYAYVDAASVGVGLDASANRELIEKGAAIKRAVMARRAIPHPEDPDLSFLYGTIFTGAAHDPAHHSRNVCVFAEGEVDRSPTGTGVSGRLALHHARGELKAGEAIVIESILGTCFSGKVIDETTCGPHAAVIPEVGGRAHVTGLSTWVVDPDDPLRDGFVLR
jgi:trans-L-3-hydroxyproline dehydratase